MLSRSTTTAIELTTEINTFRETLQVHLLDIGEKQDGKSLGVVTSIQFETQAEVVRLINALKKLV